MLTKRYSKYKNLRHHTIEKQVSYRKLQDYSPKEEPSLFVLHSLEKQKGSEKGFQMCSFLLIEFKTTDFETTLTKGFQ